MLIALNDFCSFSAHKRFTELLTKDEKDRLHTRIPMDRILTLPELKVKTCFLVNLKKCGALWTAYGLFSL